VESTYITRAGIKRIFQFFATLTFNALDFDIETHRLSFVARVTRDQGDRMGL
jgi:hypothetical protein